MKIIEFLLAAFYILLSLCFLGYFIFAAGIMAVGNVPV